MTSAEAGDEAGPAAPSLEGRPGERGLLPKRTWKRFHPKQCAGVRVFTAIPPAA